MLWMCTTVNGCVVIRGAIFHCVWRISLATIAIFSSTYFNSFIYLYFLFSLCYFYNRFLYDSVFCQKYIHTEVCMYTLFVYFRCWQWVQWKFAVVLPFYFMPSPLPPWWWWWHKGSTEHSAYCEIGSHRTKWLNSLTLALLRAMLCPVSIAAKSFNGNGSCVCVCVCSSDICLHFCCCWFQLLTLFAYDVHPHPGLCAFFSIDFFIFFVALLLFFFWLGFFCWVSLSHCLAFVGFVCMRACFFTRTRKLPCRKISSSEKVRY